MLLQQGWRQAARRMPRQVFGQGIAFTAGVHDERWPIGPFERSERGAHVVLEISVIHGGPTLVWRVNESVQRVYVPICAMSTGKDDYRAHMQHSFIEASSSCALPAQKS